MNGLHIDYNSSKKCNFGGPQNTPRSNLDRVATFLPSFDYLSPRLILHPSSI